jgi:hypothetical protein
MGNTNLQPQNYTFSQNLTNLTPPTVQATILIHPQRETTQNEPQNPNSDQIIPSRHAPHKDKTIRKPSNRPATYLTEKKFYLAQTAPDTDT